MPMTLRIALPIAPATETHCGTCPRFESMSERCGAFFAQPDFDDDGDFLRLPECIQATLPAEPWTEQRPTSGRWWVAIGSEARHLFGADEPLVYDVEVIGSKAIKFNGYVLCDIESRLLHGAKWMRREQPADPFAGGE